MSRQPPHRARSRRTWGPRSAGLAVLGTGTFSLVMAATLGITTLAPTEGVARAAWLIFSVVGLSGQTTPDSPGDKVVLVIVATWMAVAYALIIIGGVVLWRSRRRP